MKPIRVAVIGAGMIANAAHLPVLAEHVKSDEVCLVGIADPRLESAQTSARHFGIEKAYDDPQRMLEECSADLVIVCTPNAYHKQWILAAFQAGANVLCEKPVALSGEEAREMLAAAKAAKKRLFAGQSMRWYNDIQVARELIAQGEIGTPYFADVSSIRRFGVPTWGMFHMKKHNFGGPFCDIGVHIIDALLWATGNPKFVSASGSSYSRVVKSSGEVLSSLTESGAPAGVFLPRRYDPAEFSVEEFSAGRLLFENDFSVNFKIAWAIHLPSSDMDMSIVGEKGGLSTSNHMLYKNIGRYQSDISLKAYENRPNPDRPFATHYYMYEDILRCLREDAPYRVSDAEIVNMADIISCFYRAAEERREVCSKIDAL